MRHTLHLHRGIDPQGWIEQDVVQQLQYEYKRFFNPSLFIYALLSLFPRKIVQQLLPHPILLL